MDGDQKVTTHYPHLKKQKYKVGQNVLLKRFFELNNLIDKNWLLLNLDLFKNLHSSWRICHKLV